MATPTLTNTPGQTAFAKALQADLPGLLPSVAAAWTHAEVGANYNLGIMSNGQPASYRTPAEGAAAAAALIKSAPQYSGIRASLKSTDPNVQAAAIAGSPWHLGANGLAAAGGVDPYYKRIFEGFGLTIPGPQTGRGGTLPKVIPGPNAIAPSGGDIATILGSAGNAAGAASGLPLGILSGTTPSAGATVAPVVGNVFGFAAGKFLLLAGGVLCIVIGLWWIMSHETKATDPALLRVLAGGKDTAAVA
ncbi:MAG: hypothetical protein ACYDAK_13070 [Candidatus Limnocylindrales bacterium]